ncbi:hypothetical protein [Spirosoma radiotolerans]|uniref:Uncharacterized protein n=1 Tax=Spirosoma radiotolerans TaxID=1379870 RepID=A0A0E3V6H9_9BACT|nr:hypothetical protein [Spirosoma radiotolerans]AKD55037.1 hypothetical protein SD10_09100 [Spirosoma radiotolerans]
MAQSPQKIPDQNIIRTVKEVVNANADLLIVSGAATDTGFALTTEGGDEIPVDLTENFVTREEFLNSTDVPLASEEQSGRIQIVTNPEAIKGEDDSKAMTALKTLQLILSLGIPRFNLEDAVNGQSLIIEVVDSELTIKPGSASVTLASLLANSSTAEKDAFLFALYNSSSAATKAKFCEMALSCAIQPSLTVVSVDDLYSLVANTVDTLPVYLLRLDANVCGVNGSYGELRGWVANLTDLSTPASVRIEVDGQIVGTITANIARTDVRDYLVSQGHPTTAATFGFTFPKPAQFNDGKPHTWRVFGGTSSTEATSDTGALNTITCGAVANTAPRVVNAQPDVLITAPGDQTIILVAGEFATDNPNDTVTVIPKKYDGGTNAELPLPLGLTYDPATRGLKIGGSFANAAFVVRNKGVNSFGLATNDDWLLTVNRPVNPCTNYFALTEDQINALPIVVIYEYYDETVAMGTVPYTVRPFATRAEAVANIGITGSKSKFDVCRGTTNALNIGDTLYGDDRAEHITDGTFYRWPAEGGFWGFNLALPQDGNNGSYVLVQTSPCGIVTSRETIPLIAN